MRPMTLETADRRVAVGQRSRAVRRAQQRAKGDDAQLPDLTTGDAVPVPASWSA